ncbi:TPR Domain containing protein [Histomonas meleagridis]|uniref:TPR Domain containing protein n=1 Tax=Histomonas meleagridis TaxID=135588 RepID=UPI003559E467|nr:TPR Domain containing protein [Histomonas meleagridis]KAH0805324.1 TPR Domain containing protein [Histomonas meleagridis]
MNNVRILDRHPSEWLAHRFYVLEQFDMCMNVVDQILRKTPDNAEALSLKGCVLRAQGRIDEALGCFQLAYDLDSENIRHSLEIAKCLFFLGRFQQSLKILLKLEENPEGNIWEVYQLLGLNYYRLRKFSESIESFQFALDADPRLETFLELINIYDLQHDTSSLEIIIKESLKYHSNNPNLRRRIGKLLISQTKLEKALTNFEQSYSKNEQDSMSLLYSGSILQEQNHVSESLNLYRRSFQNLMNSPSLWNNVGLLIYAKHRNEAAIACFKKANFLAPYESLPLSNIGLIFLNMKMYCSAAIILRRAKKLDPSVRGAAVGLAVALMNIGEYDEAEEIFNYELQKIYSHQILINLAICYYRHGNYKDALETFNRFKRLLREEPELEKEYPNYRNEIVPLFRKINQISKE